MDYFDAKTAVVCGHSWGGHLAMHIAVAAPDRVAGLLLIDSLGAIGDGGVSTMGPTIAARIGDDGAAALAALAAEDLDPLVAAARQFAIIWPGYFKDPAAAAPMPPIAVAPSVNVAVMADALTLLAQRVLELGLPNVTAPALHVVCAHSPIDPEVNKQTATLMPNSILEVLDTGHFPWIEEPGSATASTRRLLEAVGAGTS